MEVKGLEAGDICRTSVLIFFVPRPGDLHIEKLAAFVLGQLFLYLLYIILFIPLTAPSWKIATDLKQKVNIVGMKPFVLMILTIGCLRKHSL